MQLTYRGVRYDSHPITLTVEDSGIAGTYRGQTMQFRYPRHVPAPSQAYDLKYRGVAYRNDGTRPIAAAAPQPRVADASAAFSPRVSWVARAELFAAANQVHQQNLLQRLNHRIEVARSQGNDLLLGQLEAERGQTH